MIARRPTNRGAQLGVFRRIAAGSQIEVAIPDAGIDVIERCCVGRKAGFCQLDPGAIGSSRPSVAKPRGPPFQRAFAVPAEIFDEGVKTREGLTARDRTERHQVLPRAGLAQKERGGKGGLVSIRGGLNQKLISLTELPIVI